MAWLSMEPKPESSCSWEPTCCTEPWSEQWWPIFLDVALLPERWLGLTWVTCSFFWSFFIFEETLSCPRVSFFAISSTSNRLCPGTGPKWVGDCFWGEEGSLVFSLSSSVTEWLDCLVLAGWWNLHLVPYVHFFPGKREQNLMIWWRVTVWKKANQISQNGSQPSSSFLFLFEKFITENIWWYIFTCQYPHSYNAKRIFSLAHVLPKHIAGQDLWSIVQGESVLAS